MDQQSSFHIIVIDENPAIQQDFIKILSGNTGKQLNASDDEHALKVPDFPTGTISDQPESIEHILQQSNGLQQGMVWLYA